MLRFWIAVWILSISFSTVSVWRSESTAFIAFIWDMVIGGVSAVESGCGCLVGDGWLMRRVVDLLRRWSFNGNCRVLG